MDFAINYGLGNINYLGEPTVAPVISDHKKAIIRTTNTHLWIFHWPFKLANLLL